MDRLGDRVREELGRFGPGDGGIDAITRVWPAAVGAENARRSWPARLARDGTLHANAADSIWAFQLGMLAPAILEQLRVQLGEGTPAALRFAPGPLPGEPAESSEASAEPALEIGAEHRAEAVAIAAAIEDPRLRELVARAAAASLAGASTRSSDDRRF